MGELFKSEILLGKLSGQIEQNFYNFGLANV